MDHFACEPVWIRLNAAPLPPETRSFEDSETGGSEGCFFYAVRPVGSNQVEGPIDKVVTIDMTAGQYQTSGSAATHCKAATGITSDTAITQYTTRASMPFEAIGTVLNGTGGVNTKVRGTSSPTGPPPAPQSVHRTLYEKPGVQTGAGPFADTEFASITWTMPNAPSDLLGYHIEAAGSPLGPWQRLTKSPVAWWETHYTAQGIRIPGCDTQFVQPECSSYRVIAVDADGNESQPVPAIDNPSSGTCPMTPDAPAHLTASNQGTWPNTYTRLQWDPVPGATKYTVYRLPIYSWDPYFYPTVVVDAPTTSFLDWGDYNQNGGACPNETCPYQGLDPCNYLHLNAYYVTARFASGGESPRSNLVLWQVNGTNGPGYAWALPGGEVPAANLPGELLACMNTGETDWERAASGPAASRSHEVRADDARAPGTPHELATAPMTRLGVIPDPPWAVLNLHTDHLGTVRLVTDMSSHAVSRHDYFPFGEEVTPQFSYNTHQYTGHERDRESGLDYMLARYYGAAASRFLSVDPVAGDPAEPQTWNRFGYASNNPISRVDPDGKIDIRTDDEKEMMSDPDVSLAMGEASLSADGGNECGFAAIKGEGDYTTTPVTEGDRTSVFVPNPPGAAGRFHTHRSGTIRDSAGKTEYIDPNKPGPSDEPNAQATGTKGYILAPAGLIRVVGPANSQLVVTGKDWRKLEKNLRRAAKAVRKANKVLKREAQRQKDK
jgi:RHS repeat-associated protein